MRRRHSHAKWLGIAIIALAGCGADAAPIRNTDQGRVLIPCSAAVTVGCVAGAPASAPGLPASAGAGAVTAPPVTSPPVPVVPPATIPPPVQGAAGVGVMPPIPPRPPVGVAGSAAPAAAGGMAAAAGGMAMSTGGAGATMTGVPADELEMLRQVCVDEINMYRATLPSLKPLKRATPAQEMCSDMGAQMDGDSMQAHGAAKAGLCQKAGLYSEDTCPGWPVGGRGGQATIADALKGCLMQMWAEGEPPVSRAECQKDYEGCFSKYGHYLNMSDSGVGSVACSFYKMTSGKYWMNQDFAR